MDKNYHISQSSQFFFGEYLETTEDNSILYGPKCLMGKERFKYLNPFSAILMTGITFAAVKTRDMKFLALLLPILYNNFDF